MSPMFIVIAFSFAIIFEIIMFPCFLFYILLIVIYYDIGEIDFDDIRNIRN